MAAITVEAPKAVSELIAVEPTFGDRSIDQAALEWANHHNMTDAWVVAIVRNTLSVRRDIPGVIDSGFRWNHPGFGGVVLDLPPAPMWNPIEEQEEVFDYRIARYKDEMRTLVADRGAVPTPTKREPQHFAWVVRYQVLGMPYKNVASNVDAGTASKAIRTTARLIGLTLRT